MLLPVLVFVGFVVSIIGTLGALMIPTIANAQNVSLETAQWLLTITLLVGAVSTPFSGRLADGPLRRYVILVTLALVLAGSVLAAIAGNFPLLLAGRALQGLGQSLIPLAIAVARDRLPAAKLKPGIAILSITTAAGAGLGYPITGFIAQHFNYQAGFWFAAIVTTIALILVFLVVPSNASIESKPLDFAGAMLLSFALISLLLPISQGRSWGWGSDRVIGLLILSLVLTGIWIIQELRTPYPLVELRLITKRTVLAADLAALLIGIALYGMSSLINRFMQTPASAGYGFDSSLVMVGITLMPLAFGSIAASKISSPLTARIGPGRVLSAGAIIVGLDMLYLAFTRTYRWELMIATFVLGIGVGLTFAMMPALIIRSVPPTETGSATGLNQVLRLVGGSMGSAASIAILSAHVQGDSFIPADSGYTVAFAAGAILCFIAAFVCFVLIRETKAETPIDRKESANADLDLLEEEAADAAGAGLIIVNPR
jgi:MFS family permease